MSIEVQVIIPFCGPGTLYMGHPDGREGMRKVGTVEGSTITHKWKVTGIVLKLVEGMNCLQGFSTEEGN